MHTYIYIYIYTIIYIIIIQLYIIHFACILYTVYTLAVCLCHSPGNISPKVSFSKRTPSPSPSSSNLCCFISQHKEILHRAIAVAPGASPSFLGGKPGNPQARSPGFACGTGGSRRCLGSRSCGSTAFGLDLAARWQGSAPRGRNASVVTRIPWTQDIHRNVHFYRYVCVCASIYLCI